MAKKRKKSEPEEEEDDDYRPPVPPMPKGDPPVKDPPLDDPRGQVREMVFGMESYQKHKVECFVCMEKDSDRDKTATHYARELYQAGWRVVSSEKFQTIGILCPECVKTPDKDRGED